MRLAPPFTRGKMPSTEHCLCQTCNTTSHLPSEKGRTTLVLPSSILLYFKNHKVNIIVLTLKMLVTETSLYLNFSVQGIEKIILNGVILQEPAYLNHRVNLNTDECRELLKVENEVKIEYCQRYNTNRVGLHSFTDQRTSVRNK